ncbi:SUMF1/EgtB/PvdO family nonheme iron enzyme, partial [Moraxella sp.]|uniref:formylglycine-generating enzyme family protein n=1 Tax=Moraxella sp. TaxID=479 RepID=UPI002627AD29
RDRLKDGRLGPEMVRIPAGRFRMGDIQGGGDGDEKPVHRVSVSEFAMGRYEVTFAEYDKFAQATGRKKPDDEGWGRGNRPVINVSWDDAVAYAKWLSQQTGKQYRLPTEAEWEYAARAGTETQYWWGNEIGQNRAVCDACGSRWDNKQTAPVGSFAANPFSLYDTVGNVWEWTCSEYEDKYSGKE